MFGIWAVLIHDGPRSHANSLRTRPFSIWGTKCSLQTSLMLWITESSFYSKGLLSSNASVFLLFPTYIRTHALHHDLLRHFTLHLDFCLCSSLSASLQTSLTLSSWNHVQKWQCRKARCYWQHSAMYKLFTLCNWKWMQILVANAATNIVFYDSLRTFNFSVYPHFAFYIVCIVL